MGSRCPAPLKFLWLTLALSQANLPGSQQATPAPTPPSPAPAANSAAAVQAAPPEQTDFRKDNLSHLHLKRGDLYIDVYLFAPDEKVEVLKDPYCGGDEGAKECSGHFQLISVVDGVPVSTMNLDPDDWFVEGKAHDGARLFHEPKTGQDIVAVYQYGTCSSETVQFISLDAEGHLFSIPFLERDGRTWKERLTGSTGAIPHFDDGAVTFCSYANHLGYYFCDAYTFDGANFLDDTKWVTREMEAPLRGLNDAGIAARALFEFLSALSGRSYSAAAYYADVRMDATGPGQASAKGGQKAAFLEKYCTVMRGQCLSPMDFESKPSAGAPATLLFQVELETADFQPVRIGARSSFEFRVAKTSDGFKVLDLPPRVP